MKQLILFLAITLSAIQSYSQQFHFKNYSLEEGLSRSGVYYILQDNAGFLWVGTEGGGVCKFDGIKFKNYTRQDGLAAEKVRVIFQDDRNVIWFGTTHGLTYYDGKEFKSLTTEDGLADNFIRSITQDSEGHIWVGTNRGISILDPDKKGISGELVINFSLPHMKVRSLLAQKDVMWIGTDKGLCKYKDDSIEVINTEHGLSNDLILCLFTDVSANLWVGTQHGINRVSGDIIKYWTEEDGLVNNRVRSITEDMYGQMWIGTSDGISVLNEDEFLSLTNENGLSNERIRCLTSDRFNNIWVGTFFGGIMRFSHQNFIAYTPTEGLVSNQIFSINEDEKGDIIVGTYDGVSKLKIVNDKLVGYKTVNLENGLVNNAVTSVFKDENANYWYGTAEGVSVIGNGKVTLINEEDGLENTEITVIKKYNDTYWIGTAGGLGIVEETDDYINFDVKFIDIDDGLAGSEVAGIDQDVHGDVWISFSDGQISIFEESKFVNPVLPPEVKEILAIAIDTLDRVWLGTNGKGLYHGDYNNTTNEIELINISTKDNLHSNSVYSLLVIGDQIWAGHENGLDLINWTNDTTYTIQSFGPETGFFGMQNNQNASYQDTQGNLWFGTVNGLFCLKRREIDQFTEGTSSINYISTVKINDKKIDWSNSEWADGVEGNFNLPRNLTLPYNENNIDFEFIGINLVSPTSIKYSWKLEGFQSNWTSPSKKNYVSYTNLEPGKYSFLLKSSNQHGTINGDPIRFKFEVEKPFWSTWLFRIAAIIVITLLVFLITSMRTRQLIKQRKALEAIISERTREISDQANELKLKNKEVTDSITYSKRIQGSILPSTEQLNHLIKKHFIFYHPKDIVSGDFYWAEASVGNKNQKFFAIADCTGHGVPGAMVSMISTRALGTAVREMKLTHTNDILDHANKIVVDAFTDAVSGEIIKDGMDISLCALDYTDKKEIKFQFSGAQNPVWVVRKEEADNIIINGAEQIPNMIDKGYKLFEIKGDKQPIGYFEDNVPFTVASGTLQKGDRLYLFTDGFADQFGGEKGKKFKYKTLKKLILSVQIENIEAQYGDVTKAFYDWKRDIEQVDDVCFMGVEV
jgi:ligand-binding sensor domain-containing protein